MKKFLSLLMVVAMLASFGFAYAASGEASGEAVNLYAPAPVFRQAVCVMEKGRTDAEFIVKGWQSWDENNQYLGLEKYSADDAVIVYEGYDGYAAETPVNLAVRLTAIDGSDDLLLTIPAAGLTKNTVYYVSIAGHDASPVYIVTYENASAVDADHAVTFELGSSEPGDGYTDSFTLPLSSYAMIPDENNVRLGGAYGLFTAADYTDVPADAADAVNWYLTTGGTNGGVAFDQFGSEQPYARLDACHYLYRFFCFEGSGGFGMFSDVGMARWFSGSSGANTAYAWVDILEHSDPLDSYKPMTVQDMVVMMYNSITTPFGSRTEAGKALADALKAEYDGSGAAGKLAAMAALGRYDKAAYPDPAAEVTKLDAAKLLFVGLADYEGEKINCIRPQLDADFLDAVTTAGEAGELDGYEDASAEIDALGVAEKATLSAASSEIVRESGIIENETFNNDGIANASALIVQDGANVTLLNSRIVSSGSNPSDPLLDRDYRFGYGAGLLAVDEGTVVKIINTNGELNTTGASNGSMAGCLYTGTGSVIYAENGQFFSAGQHPSNTCYDGTLIYNGSTLTGGGRTFSTDFFGGKVIFYNSVSNQLKGNGFVIDESTSYMVVNSYVYGGSSFETNGQGQAYYQNSVIQTKGSWIMQNNTSMRSDWDYVCGVNSQFICASPTFLTVQKEEKAVCRFVDSDITVGEGDAYVIKVSGDEWQTNSALKLELVNTDFPAGKIFVAGARDWPNLDVHTDGAVLAIETDGNSALDLTQTVNETCAITTYEDGTTEVQGRMGMNYSTDLVNNGTVTLNGVETGLSVENGAVSVKNAEYAEVSVSADAVTAVYTVNGAKLTLVWKLADGETAAYNAPSGEAGTDF